MMDFLKQEKVPVAYIGIGPVHRRDVMKASIQMDKDRKYGVMLAFDVPVDRDAQVPPAPCTVFMDSMHDLV